MQTVMLLGSAYKCTCTPVGKAAERGKAGGQVHTWRRVVAGGVLDAHAGRQPRAEVDVLPLEGQVALVERRQARKLPRGHSAVPSPTASQMYYDLP